MNQTLGNYVRVYRKKSGLSQSDLGLLLGYNDKWQVSRHERSHSTPPLLIALAYEIIFRVPVSELFTGIHTNVARMIESNLGEFEKALQQRSDQGRALIATAQKLQWLEQRRTRV